MASVFDQDDVTFQVLVNHEEQHSIWPDYKEIPKGWKTVGQRGLKKHCSEYIEKTWLDMRPLNLHKAMEEQEKSQSVEA